VLVGVVIIIDIIVVVDVICVVVVIVVSFFILVVFALVAANFVVDMVLIDWCCYFYLYWWSCWFCDLRWCWLLIVIILLVFFIILVVDNDVIKIEFIENGIVFLAFGIYNILFYYFFFQN
jgi:hypothetical protein